MSTSRHGEKRGRRGLSQYSSHLPLVVDSVSGQGERGERDELRRTEAQAEGQQVIKN